MKILMLTPYLPYPPSEGGQVRSYKLIKLLSQRHEITLVCFSRQHNTPDQVAHLKQFCRQVFVIERGKTWTLKNILRTGFSPYPFLVSIYHSPGTKRILTEALASDKFDLIHAEMSYTLPYLPPHNLPVILVEQTIMSRIFGHQISMEPKWWFKPLMWIDVQKMKYWEKYYWKKASSLIAVSQEDATIMQRLVPDLSVQVVPNGVGEDFDNLPMQTHYNHTLFYMGNYKWIQNWEAAELLAKKVFSHIIGLIATLLYATTPTIVLANRLSLTENLLAPLALLVLIILLNPPKSPKNSLIQVAILGVISALAFLTKQIGLAVSMSLISIYWLRQQWRSILIIAGLTGLAIFIYLGFGFYYDGNLFLKLQNDVRHAHVLSGLPEIIFSLFRYTLCTWQAPAKRGENRLKSAATDGGL